MLDRDRFAGSGVADDDHRFPFHDVEGESFEDSLGSESLVNVDQSDQCGKRKAGSGKRWVSIDRNVIWGGVRG